MPPRNAIDLSGDWAFCYVPASDPESLSPPDAPPSIDRPTPPADDEFDSTMPMPGYWDENWDRLRHSNAWSKAAFSEHRPMSFPSGPNPPNGSLPHLRGVGWYRRTLPHREMFDCDELMAWLHLGAVRLKAWIWVNGEFAGCHDDHATPVKVAIHPYLRDGVENTFTIAVTNIGDLNGHGCEVRGWKGRAAGIRRPAEIIFADGAAITNLFGAQDCQTGEILWEVTCESRGDGELTLDWRLVTPSTGEVVQRQTVPCSAGTTRWSSSAHDLAPWSDEHPELYQVDAILRRNGTPVHELRQAFGLRRLHAEGSRLYLNGKPIYLRGATDHAYYPETCVPPSDKKYYLARLRKLKEIGFNWLRFHTWVPPEEYLAAADEVGMLMQVEMPRGYSINTRWQDVEDTAESRALRQRGVNVWKRVVARCRRHPSVVLYCGGNEEWLSEYKIDELSGLAGVVHESAPNALFSPMESLSGVLHPGPPRSNPRVDGIADQLTPEPFPHHPQRLARLREFSDVFEPSTFMQLSYLTLTADPLTLDRRLGFLERPILAHELGITSGFLDPGLAHRYDGTMIGSELYDAARAHMKHVGLLHRAPVYARNGAEHQRMLRKHNLENTRLCRTIVGYDYLGPTDQHWHRWGYDAGVLNEFFELKPGGSRREVLRYNAATVLLCDHRNRRVFHNGDQIALPILISHFANHGIEDALLRWKVTDESSQVICRGSLGIRNVRPGELTEVGDITFVFPEGPPRCITLRVGLDEAPILVENAWDFWTFPKMNRSTSPDAVSAITPELYQEIRRGRRVLLLGSGGLPSQELSFQSAFAGRPQGNVATVIEEHPLWGDFPRKMWCEWQFHQMIEGGRSVLFDELASPFDPILELVSPYKEMHPQAGIFEYRVGRGGFVACTLDLDKDNPAAVYLGHLLSRYRESNDFSPAHELHEDDAHRLCDVSPSTTQSALTNTDIGFDPLE